jgi:virginiamycin B lyase
MGLRRMNVNRWIAFTIGLAAAGALLQPSSAPARRASSHIASSPQTGGANRIVPGYPLILASGAGGGVWYGGNRSGSAEPVDQVGYITAAGAFLSFRLGSELANHWPEYFAGAKDGGEWFLAEARGVNLPLLAEISPRGHVHVLHLALDPSTEVRGLALGADGNLWTTATRIRGLSRESTLLRISPAGTVTTFSHGLQRGAIPENITAARGRLLWFTDAVGRIGRIDTTGRIQEFALGRQIVASTQRYAPTPGLVTARDGTIWLIAGPRTLGHLIAPGRLHLFTPPSSYRPPQDAGERGNLVGLVAAPEGGVWFTRESGEVARIDAHGRLTTRTNRLLNAYGIAFGRGDVAWVGAASSEGEGEYETPARLARLSGPSGSLTQFPPRPKCEAPALIRLDRVFAEQAVLGNPTSGCEERVLLGHVRFINSHRAGLYVVVSQTPRAGTASDGYLRARVADSPARRLQSTSVLPAPGHRHPADRVEGHPGHSRRLGNLLWLRAAARARADDRNHRRIHGRRVLGRSPRLCRAPGRVRVHLGRKGWRRPVSRDLRCRRRPAGVLGDDRRVRPVQRRPRTSARTAAPRLTGRQGRTRFRT